MEESGYFFLRETTSDHPVTETQRTEQFIRSSLRQLNQSQPRCLLLSLHLSSKRNVSSVHPSGYQLSCRVQPIGWDYAAAQCSRSRVSTPPDEKESVSPTHADNPSSSSCTRPSTKRPIDDEQSSVNQSVISMDDVFISSVDALSVAVVRSAPRGSGWCQSHHPMIIRLPHTMSWIVHPRTPSTACRIAHDHRLIQSFCGGTSHRLGICSYTWPVNTRLLFHNRCHT